MSKWFQNRSPLLESEGVLRSPLIILTGLILTLRASRLLPLAAAFFRGLFRRRCDCWLASIADSAMNSASLLVRLACVLCVLTLNGSGVIFMPQLLASDAPTTSGGLKMTPEPLPLETETQPSA